MEPYQYTTRYPLNTNEELMNDFLDNHFYAVFEIDSYLYRHEGTYSEVKDADNVLWGVHASGDGDEFNHIITFEKLEE